jgi:hypothetical protein
MVKEVGDEAKELMAGDNNTITPRQRKKMALLMLKLVQVRNETN